MHKYFIIILFSLLALSCHQNNLKKQLVEIDSLSNKESNQATLDRLEDIIPEAINDEECIAYYWLLKTRTELRMQKKIESTSQLDVSIAYYKEHKDYSKLIRGFLYKSQVLINLNNTHDAIQTIKEAEYLLKDYNKEASLTYSIYHQLAVLNNKAKEEQLALHYGKLSLSTAYQLNSEIDVIYALMTLYNAYDGLGNRDSALYYLNRCIPLIEVLPRNERFPFYANIGNSYLAQQDYKKAEDYLNRSIKIEANAYAYNGLSRVHYANGKKEKARELWAKALKTDNLYLKQEVLQAIYESQREEGDYKTACETAMHIVALKDTIAEKQRTEDIKGVQENFDIQRSKEQAELRAHLMMTLAALILIVSSIVLLYAGRNINKNRTKLRDAEKQLTRYRQRLTEIQQNSPSMTQQKEVERLTQKICDLQKKQGAILANGHERYEEVVNQKGTTIRWNRNDFSDCLEYYRTIDAAFLTHMETDYNHLSAKYTFVTILEHLGKSDEDVCNIMGISTNTLRSIHSRINSVKVSPK